MKTLQQIRVTKQFSFEAAHLLWGHDGKCKNIHGHSYQLHVTLIGKAVNDKNNPKYGMVMDFSEIKNIVGELIIKPFDHSLMVNENAPLNKSGEAKKLAGRIMPLPYQPTCENLIADFANRLSSKLKGPVKLYSLLLRETPSSYAEWYASDNKD